MPVIAAALDQLNATCHFLMPWNPWARRSSLAEQPIRSLEVAHSRDFGDTAKKTSRLRHAPMPTLESSQPKGLVPIALAMIVAFKNATES